MTLLTQVIQRNQQESCCLRADSLQVGYRARWMSLIPRGTKAPTTWSYMMSCDHTKSLTLLVRYTQLFQQFDWSAHVKYSITKTPSCHPHSPFLLLGQHRMTPYQLSLAFGPVPTFTPFS